MAPSEHETLSATETTERAGKKSRSNDLLGVCACGQRPTALGVNENGQGPKREPMAPNAVRDLLKTDPYAQRMLRLVKDDTTARNFVDTMLGIVRAVEAAHGITDT